VAPLLDIRNLNISFPAQASQTAALRAAVPTQTLPAVRELSFSIAPGEVLGLVGESGSGKSTLARALTGLVPLDAGEVRLGGRLLRGGRRSRADQRRIQMVFQDPYSSLNPRLTVGGMLHELLRVHHVVPKSEVDSYSRELARLVGLDPDSLHAYPRQFSGGQRQRVAIARALVNRPELLLADEPTGALDSTTGQEIAGLLRELNAGGQTLVLVTHDQSLAQRFAARTVQLVDGELMSNGAEVPA